MKDFLKQMLDSVENPILGRFLCREYLQARVLQSLQDHGAFSTWVFQGGTALRFLYSIPRFSEGLDFALVAPHVEDKFGAHLDTVVSVFEAEGYDVDVRVTEGGCRTFDEKELIDSTAAIVSAKSRGERRTERMLA